MKPGWKTTEFWASAIVIAGSTVATVTGSLPDKYAVFGSAIAAGLYALSRGLAKTKGP